MSPTLFLNLKPPFIFLLCALMHLSNQLLSPPVFELWIFLFSPSPYTCVVFVIGIVYAATVRGRGQYESESSSLANSIRVMSSMSPHQLLFIFLPSLVFGDSIMMNIHHFRRTFFSSCLVAGPGAVAAAFIIASTSKYLLLYQWSWEYCLVFGACLCTTDSVAVASVLKDAGAAPSLTTFLIQNALINDGTALVLFNFFLNGKPVLVPHYTDIRANIQRTQCQNMLMPHVISCFARSSQKQGQHFDRKR